MGGKAYIDSGYMRVLSKFYALGVIVPMAKGTGEKPGAGDWRSGCRLRPADVQRLDFATDSSALGERILRFDVVFLGKDRHLQQKLEAE